MKILTNNPVGLLFSICNTARDHRLVKAPSVSAKVIA